MDGDGTEHSWHCGECRGLWRVSRVRARLSIERSITSRQSRVKSIRQIKKVAARVMSGVMEILGKIVGEEEGGRVRG